jgi:hypothetical protein
MMGNRAQSSLFYGVVLNVDESVKFTKKILGNDLDRNENDLGELFYELKKKGEFKWVCIDPFDNAENMLNCIASYEKKVYEYDFPPKKFKLPNQEVVDNKWQKIAEKYGIKKKPGWHLTTEYS